MNSDDDDRGRQLRPLLQQHRSGRAGVLERDTPFSWARCFISLFSYALLLSDVVRTGLGIQHNAQYPTLEPNQLMFFGPYAYPVAHIAANRTAGTQDVWAFKYDTTSIAMRAFAEFLQLESWSPCLLYKTPCLRAPLELASVFRMMDSLIDALSRHKPRRGGVSSLTLRTRNAWRDRIHHFVLPQVFREHMTRTSQAIYYGTQLLDSPGFNFCSHLPSQAQPYACSDFWTHVAPLCRRTNPLCRGVGHVFQHALTRHRSLQQKYGDMSLDLVVLESQDDHSKPAVSFHGRKFFDVVVVTRVRNCTTQAQASLRSEGSCRTIAVDDYRYEGASFTSDVISWFSIIAALRSLGQAYAWCRLCVLLLGCFFARSAEPRYANASLLSRMRAGLRTAFTIPSQVVIYGSIAPITCYVLAHLLDSAMVYELVAQTFNSPLGVFKLNVREFLQLGAVSMRSVWVLAFLLHALVYARTRRNWSAPSGIPGIPEFSITFISCLTIMAQFRSVAFRDSRVNSISEVVQSARVASIRASAYDNSRGFWGLVLVGNTLDAKCLLGSTAVLGALLFLAGCCLRVVSRVWTNWHVCVFAWPNTRVSYAAGALWTANALVVSWNDMLLLASGGTAPGSAIIRIHAQVHQKQPALEDSNSIFTARERAHRVRLNRVRVTPTNIQEASRLLRHDFAVLDERSSAVESMIYLINLAVMTDPIVLFRVWQTGGKSVAVLQSKATGKLFLIPHEAVASQHDAPVSWDNYGLVVTVSTNELSWQDLLQCG